MPGRRMTSTPRKPSAIVPARLTREALAEEQHREQAGPHRHHELDREHGRERQHDHGIRPAQVGDEVRAVAHEMRDRLAQREVAKQRGLQRHHDEQEHEPADRAHHQQLEQVQHAAEIADRDRHQRERQQRADHPEDGSRHVGGSRRRLLRFAQSARLDGSDVVTRRSFLFLSRRRYSASGWFSGRALSKAGSFRQAASTAEIFGYFAMSTLKRRALNTCGTRQRSAIVTCAPNA